MKKFISIIILSLIIILLSGCDKKENDDFFTKKQECFKYREQVLEKLDKQEINSLQHNEQLKFLYREDLEISYYLDEIFYSKAKNSCLVAYNIYESWKELNYDAREKEFEYSNHFYIEDILTSENYYSNGSFGILYNKKVIDEIKVKNEYNVKLQELKGY